MTCRHPKSYRWTHRQPILRGDDRSDWLIFITCRRCNSWLPLGHSDETPVAHEVRAAEIAINLSEDGCEMSMLEQCGFNEEYPKLRGGADVMLNTASQHAGYLARVILEHKP